MAPAALAPVGGVALVLLQLPADLVARHHQRPAVAPAREREVEGAEGGERREQAQGEAVERGGPAEEPGRRDARQLAEGAGHLPEPRDEEGHERRRLREAERRAEELRGREEPAQPAERVDALEARRQGGEADAGPRLQRAGEGGSGEGAERDGERQPEHLARGVAQHALGDGGAGAGEPRALPARRARAPPRGAARRARARRARPRGRRPR